jgi:uncharacterized protein (TIGR03118 family)
MSHTSNRVKALAVAAGLLGGPAIAAPVQLSDAQLGAVPAGINFSITNQVSDQAGVAPVTDPNLVNAWGLSQGPNTILWVANNGSDTSTLYNPTTFAKAALTVNVPGAPTGTTFVGIPNAFNVSAAGKTGNTVFAFATEGGQIQGWSPAVNVNNAIVAVDESTKGAVFKGLTLGMNGSQPLLFASNFTGGRVEVFNQAFQKVGSFTDPILSLVGMSPFNVQTLNGQLYVTFAERLGNNTDETAQPGLGAVDVFNMSGQLVRRLAIGGRLDAPWGLAIAPASFGQFAGALLVGNFGDGQINAYDPNTGKYLGRLTNSDGSGVKIDGLWALHSGANGTITFSAGPADESHGLLGSLGPAAAGMAGFGADEVASLAEMHR